MGKIPTKLVRAVDLAVAAYEKERLKYDGDAANLQTRLLSNSELKKLIHSLKWRAKDPASLRDKLIRKALEADMKGKSYNLKPAAVLERIPDLAGVRLLHLNMRQMEKIHPLIQDVLTTEGYVLHEPPEAKTWDPEYERMFLNLGVKVLRKESLYTSVHYVIKQNSKTKRLCELQVRTLAEEIWGEVSHAINYPHETDSVACQEQLRVLARLVSGCSRLVDSIARSFEDHAARSPAPK
jgi:putative GTP pyrophosphokinase